MNEAYEHLNKLTQGEDRTVEVSLSLLCDLIDRTRPLERGEKWQLIYDIEAQLRRRRSRE